MRDTDKAAADTHHVTLRPITRLGLKMIRCQGKRPVDAWTEPSNQTDDVERAATWLRQGYNLGAVVAGRVVAVDLDVKPTMSGLDEWLKLGLELNTLNQVTGSGGRHLFFALPDGVQLGNGTGRLPKGIDIRAGGKGFVVVAPSKHPTTHKPYVWADPEAPVLPLPGKVLDLLQRQTGRSWSDGWQPDQTRHEPARPEDDPSKPLATAWCALHWPQTWRSTEYGAAALRRACYDLADWPVGARGSKLNREAFVLGGLVKAGKLDAGECARWLLAAAKLCGLARADGIENVREAIARAIEAGRERGARAGPAALWPDQAEDVGPPRARIMLRAGEQARVYEEIGQALAVRGTYYERGGEMVIVEEDGRPRIKVVSGRATLLEVANCADFVAMKPRTRKQEDGSTAEVMVEVPVNVPAEEVITWRASPQAMKQALRTLLAVSAVPVLRVKDGSLRLDDGYDEATRLEVRLGGLKVPTIRTAFQNQAEAQACAGLAMAELMDAVNEFAFESHGDRSVFAALVLTALVRPQLPTAPLFIVDSSTRGTGKGLLVDVAAILATGHPKHAIGWPSQRDEQEKTVFALLRMAEAFVCIDNITEQLGGNALDIALTSDEYAGRILGQSTIETLPTRVTLTATGNNVAVKGDLVRRSLRCRLSCDAERPELRTFQRSDLLGWVKEHRGRLVGAGLQVLAAFVAAGRPSMGLTRLGSFSEWSALVRCAVVWCGEADPVETQLGLEADADTAKEALLELLESLHVRFGGKAWTVADVVHEAKLGRAEDQRLADAVALATGKDASDAKAVLLLGKYVSRSRDRVVKTTLGPTIIRPDTMARGSRRWRVEVGS